MATRPLRRAAGLSARGAISGVLAWALIVGARKLGIPNDELRPGLLVSVAAIAPGLVFGVMLGAYLVIERRLDAMRAVAYCLASGISYYAAFHVAYHLLASEALGRSLAAFSAAGVAAGLTGSALLALLSMPLLRGGIARLRLSVVVGTLAGALLPVSAIEGFEIVPGLGAFFAIWQGAYAASLAPAIDAMGT
jgi:hypothetical protein